MPSTPSVRRTAVFVSPHLDDVAFSCGGTLALFRDLGWRTVLVTVFTASVDNPTGFALACQTDKGLSPEVDYMALRRKEDQDFARLIGVDEVRWLDFLEAPHRGYESALELFGGVREDDQIHCEVARVMAELQIEFDPLVAFLPQGLGNHVDHLQLIRGSLEVPDFANRAIWYRDLPYAIRHPESRPTALGVSQRIAFPIVSTLKRKLDAASCYRTQLGFQFGGEWKIRETLEKFAFQEGKDVGSHEPCEVFLTTSQVIEAANVPAIIPRPSSLGSQS